MNTFTTTKPPRLSIDTKAGTVSIETVDGDQTTVEITPLDDHDVTLDALLGTTVEQHGAAVLEAASRKDHCDAHGCLRFSRSGARGCRR